MALRKSVEGLDFDFKSLLGDDPEQRVLLILIVLAVLGAILYANRDEVRETRKQAQLPTSPASGSKPKLSAVQ